MFQALKDHPFPVEAHFEQSIVLTFAVPKEELEIRIPACLVLDTFEGKWAFLAVALVQTKALRPKGFPAFMGNNFFLIGYRIFVKYHNNKGKRLRGLYILKSETNKKKMEWLGNLFTHYNYTTTDIQQRTTIDTIAINSIKSNLQVTFRKGDDTTLLPEKSPFADWKEARRFAGPMPFTFTYKADRKEVLIIEGVRQNWTPKPIEILDYECGFLKTLALKEIVLANAFIIEDVPYYWKAGIIEPWQG